MIDNRKFILERDRSRVTKRRSGAAKLHSAFNKLRRLPVEVNLSCYWKSIERIHDLRKSQGFTRRTDVELKRLSEALAFRLRSGQPLESLAVEAFALVFEASRRTLGLTPHDVQMIAGLAMCSRRIAEMPTGEGKTLAAVSPAFLFGLLGRGVHILTFNDYLARRDAAWMGPIYRLLGLSVGCVQERMSKILKREAYACDVTYATAKEAGFDFLRDQLVWEAEETVHRPFHAALLDEADSILIDEARVPLIISGETGDLNRLAGRLAPLIRRLTPGEDYTADEGNRTVFLTDGGLDKLEGLIGCGNLYAFENEHLLAAVHCALHAQALLRRDVDYIVRNGRIEIVDEFTGRVMDRRHWPEGLQAAVETKERLHPTCEGRVLSSITLQHFFRLYPKLCGMTATARPSALELKEFYELDVIVVPPHRPCLRVDLPDIVFTHKEAKLRCLIREIVEVNASSRPILVGTLSVKESEDLASALRRAGVCCHVLNAKNDELEARIIADAGKPGAVTISTNMAGRGTDIKLGGADEKGREKVVLLGGLYVIGANRHESLRIDQQLRGRAGRQGDPGSSRFFISLEDDIFERYGLSHLFLGRHGLRKQDGKVDDLRIPRDVIHAQKIIEGRNFEIRKSLWNFSSLIERQRRIVQEWRDAALRSGETTAWLETRAPRLLKKGSAGLGQAEFERVVKAAALFHLDRCWADHLAWLSDVRESIHLASVGGKEPFQEFQKSATAAFFRLEEKIKRGILESLESLVERQEPIDLEAEGLKGPSSTWTYFINEEQLGWGIELLKGRNIGFAAAAAGGGYTGPLLVLALILKRLSKKRRKSKK
jgi:preprotein translocase subunit SecA